MCPLKIFAANLKPNDIFLDKYEINSIKTNKGIYLQKIIIKLFFIFIYQLIIILHIIYIIFIFILLNINVNLNHL